MHPQVFSFKIRGAYNLMANLNEEERWRGVVTCSAGKPGAVKVDGKFTC